MSGCLRELCVLVLLSIFQYSPLLMLAVMISFVVIQFVNVFFNIFLVGIDLCMCELISCVVLIP